MRVISVIGITKSGKTTTIENIIKELKKRKYTVGSVKEIHYENFQIDTEGTNTYRHKEAGSELVTARGYYETDILFQEKLSLDKILSFYQQDFVILEGVSDRRVPKIITAHDIQGIEMKMDDTAFAISGVISEEISEYKNLPAINSLNNVEDLVDLIEEKTQEQVCKKEYRENTKLEIKIKGKKIELKDPEKKLFLKNISDLLGKIDINLENDEIDICMKK